MRIFLASLLTLTGCKSSLGDVEASSATPQRVSVSITSPLQASTTGAVVPLFFSAAMNAVTYDCQVDSLPVVCDPVSGAGAANLADGVHIFSVSVTDNLGNIETASVTWQVDAIGPAVAITSPAPATITQSGVLQFNASDAVIFICTLDGSAMACNPGDTYSNLGVGPHTLVIRGIDAYGNLGPTTSVTWTAN